jgi:flagellar basal-body rod protein FlgB
MMAARMDVSEIGLFALADRRLAWLDRRQELLAHNVANADTPGWQPRDLGPFAAALSATGGVAPVRTQPNHLSGTTTATPPGVVERPSERAPDGNAVSMQEQLMKVAATESSQELVTNLYTKYLGFFRLALGHG